MRVEGIILFLALVAGSCGPKEDVQLRAINIKEVRTGADGNPVMFADVVFFNPNSGRMRVKKIDLDVFVDGKKTARVDQELSLLIKSNSEFTIPLEVQLNFKETGLLDTIISLLGGKQHDIQFEGKMKVSMRGFPVNVPVSYKEVLKF